MTARVLLVRHADAGDRAAWSAPDELRPLSERGLRQAEALARELRGFGVERVLTSAATRCRQTVEPLARAVGRVVTDDGRLMEGEPVEPVLDLIRRGGDAVLCSHGDVIGDVLLQLGPACGVRVDRLRCAKASTWVFEVRRGEVVAAAYRPAPKA